LEQTDFEVIKINASFSSRKLSII